MLKCHIHVDLNNRIIKYSGDLEELDLHNNTIGNLNAKIILNALEYRKLSN